MNFPMYFSLSEGGPYEDTHSPTFVNEDLSLALELTLSGGFSISLWKKATTRLSGICDVTSTVCFNRGSICQQ